MINDHSGSDKGGDPRGFAKRDVKEAGYRLGGLTALAGHMPGLARRTRGPQLKSPQMPAVGLPPRQDPMAGNAADTQMPEPMPGYARGGKVEADGEIPEGKAVERKRGGKVMVDPDGDNDAAEEARETPAEERREQKMQKRADGGKVASNQTAESGGEFSAGGRAKAKADAKEAKADSAEADEFRNGGRTSGRNGGNMDAMTGAGAGPHDHRVQNVPVEGPTPGTGRPA